MEWWAQSHRRRGCQVVWRSAHTGSGLCGCGGMSLMTMCALLAEMFQLMNSYSIFQRVGDLIVQLNVLLKALRWKH